MGTKTYIMKYCEGENKGYNRITLDKYRGKVCGIDLSNQLHKQLLHFGESAYTNGFYILNKILKQYDITPIYVFDNKPPDEKQNELNKRSSRQNGYIKKISVETDEVKAEKYKSKVYSVKNKFTECKEYFDKHNVKYIHLDMTEPVVDIQECQETKDNLEADRIMKYLFDIGVIDICLSDDTDLITYGCQIVLSGLNHKTHDIDEFVYDHIIASLNISSEQFTNAIVASGTSYNDNLKYCKFEANLALMKKYKTIANVLENLDDINASRNINRLCSVPDNFDYSKTLSIFTLDLSSRTKSKINSFVATLVVNKVKI